MSSDDELFWRLFALIQVLPELPPKQVISWLGGDKAPSPSLSWLEGLSISQLEASYPGDADCMTFARWQQVSACLHGELPEHLSVVPPTHRPAQIQAAFASQDGLNIDGHFGQCRLFFIYGFDEDGYWLTGLRRFAVVADQEDNETRARLVDDCQLLFCEAIGGPAAARLIRYNIHPMKVTAGTTIEDQCQSVLQMLTTSLPPWLARRLGRDNPLEQRVF
ncbi:protein NifY [Mangrovibacter sp. MFB070]|uniref:NifB/NifX family molybdenum-iron cluster-binding protein n=1 Tax=Mangrovibacter sp. MFB070 TaxID=1224318 RepID=UPI0004D5FC22|nr:NifB/NifX family molybdenum-iron cluster-binding protein [Mangrovibacter sp. MFB070]KEA52710.1 protein NifY [Mangrovibacter sp. MFB070]